MQRPPHPFAISQRQERSSMSERGFYAKVLVDRRIVPGCRVRGAFPGNIWFIQGTVTDETGAVIPGAHLTARNADTGGTANTT